MESSQNHLAHRLIEGNRESRKRLLRENPALLDEKLAEIIRRECVLMWASDPRGVKSCVAAARDLVRSAPFDLVRANAEWTFGIGAIIDAKFESAIEHLKSATDLFRDSGRERDAANVQAAMLVALAMLGRYDDAISVGLTAVPVLDSTGDLLAAGKVEMNLSNIAARRGDHVLAAEYCERARERFSRAGEARWQAMAENGLANTAAELNDFRTAEKYYRAALSTAERAEMRVTEAEILASMGNLALYTGRYSDALKLLETSRRKFEHLAMSNQSAVAELEIADIYSELNLAAEAADIYNSVCRRLRMQKLRAEEARARLNYGRVLAKLGRTADAHKNLRRAGKLFAAEANPAAEARTALARAQIAFETSDPRADELLRAAREYARRSQDQRLPIAIDLLEAEMLLQRGEMASAEKTARSILESARRTRHADAARAAHNLLGQIFAAAGDSKRAADSFNRSIRIIEKLRAPIAGEEFNRSFLAERLGPYENLAKLYLNSRKFAAALRVFENARSQSLLGAMDTGDDIKGQDEKRRDLLRVREELNSLYRRLDRVSPSEEAELRDKANAAERRVAKLGREIDSLKGAKAARRTQFNLKKLREQLGDDTTLVEYVLVDGEIGAFVVTGRRIKYFGSLATVSDVSEMLASVRFQFEALRYAGVVLEKFEPQIRRRADRHLGELYRKIFAPLRGDLVGEKVVIVPVGVLHHLSFAALFDDARYLTESFTISIAPSAGLWSRMAERVPKKINSSLLIAFADEKIPNVGREVDELRAIIPRAEVLTGEDATLAAFEERAKGCGLLHLACHGEFRSDNPMFSSLHLADGWITVRDLVEQRLDAELATLSACETGVNEIYAGDEILGLTRGFLSAGVSSLIVSLWRVSDFEAVELMKDLYKDIQRGTTFSASLQNAQKAAIARGFNPYYWAPFVFIGR